MSVLLVAQQFVPFCPSFGWTVRALTMADYLRRQGTPVQVLTSQSRYFGYFGRRDLIRDFPIHYLKDAGLARRYASLAPGMTSRDWLDDWIVPDRGIRMLPGYYRQALRMLRRGGLRNLVTTSPPHSTQLLGLLLKLRLGSQIHWVADFRDGWNTQPRFRKELLVPAVLSRSLERLVLRTCDRTSFVSQTTFDEWKTKLNCDLSGKAALIGNGLIELPRWKPVLLRRGPLRIGFFGTLYDNTQALRALEKALNERLRSELEFHFYLPELESPSLGFGHVHSPLSHPQALARMAEMDYLLLFAAEPEVITGKVFDYLAARRPILCLSPFQTGASSLVESRGVGLTVDPRDQGAVSSVLARLKELHTGLLEACREGELESLHRDRQYQRFIQLLSPVARDP